MHGYCAACILPLENNIDASEIITQMEQKYAVITIREPFESPFLLIPNAYKTLVRYIEVNGLETKQKETLPCFEKEYHIDGIPYMDVYIAIE